MSHHRLNVNALRADRLPKLVHRQSYLPDRPEILRERALTRRGLLGMATLTALGLSPSIRIMNSLAHAATESLTWAVSDTRIVFRLGGRDRWVIDLASFSGSPRLLVRKQEGLFLVHLADARFPGTSLSADFVCELRQGAFSWNMLLTFALGGFTTYAPFERWLLGQESAGSAVRFHTPVCGMGLDGQLRLQGEGTASFRPNWSFDFKGHSLASFRGRGGDLASDVLHLALLDDQTPSLATEPGRTRTLLAMERGAQHWEFSPAFTSNVASHVVYRQNGFDTLHFETWEDSAGTPVCGVLAEGPSPESSVWFHPHSLNVDADAIPDPIAFPLAHIQYARIFSAQEHEREEILRGRFVSNPSSIKVLGCSLEVGGRPTTPPFELLNRDGEMQACCEPEVYRISVPLGGAIVDPIDLPHGTRLAWNGQLGASIIPVQVDPRLRKSPSSPIPKVTVPQQEKAIQQTPAPALKQIVPIAPITPGQIKPEIVAPGRIFTDFRSLLEVHGPFTVSVLRPEDLLVLKFEFKGWTLQAATGQPARIVRNPLAPGTPASTILVHFPPQHIAEQAFFEPANPSQAEKPVYPIKAQLAGWSRLVFNVPQNITQIPFSLETLLDWSLFELNVAASAAPPPPPPPSLGRLKIQIVPGMRFKQGVIPQVIPRAIPEEPAQPQSSPMPTEKRPFLWYTSTNGQSAALYQAQAVLVRAETRTVQLQLRKPQVNPQAVQPIQKVPVQPPSQAIVPGVVQKLPGQVFQLLPDPPKKEDLPNLTVIEAPYRLFMSPSKMGGWAHSPRPVALNNRMELWHTRLGVRRQDRQGQWRIDEDDDWYRTLRAIWSPDYNEPDGNGPERYPSRRDQARVPFRMLPEAQHRHQLVQLMANGKLPNWQERYARAERFMLSSLGVWMKTQYAFDPAPNPLTVIEWTQHTNMGRDQFVRVIEQGFLFPFGHRAVLIQISERKIERPIPDGPLVALLRYREFIVVKEPIKTYPGPGQEQLSFSKGRNFPFQSLRITTLITPNLDPKENSKIGSVPGNSLAFWPKVSGQDFQFHLIGEDWAGDSCEFTIPLVFMTSDVGLNTGILKGVRNAYAQDIRSTTALSGQPVSYAPSVKKGDTAMETASLSFSAEIPCDPVWIQEGLMPGCPRTVTQPLVDAVNPFFFPFLAQANISIPAVKALLGPNPATAGTDVRYSDMYRVNGFGGPNLGELFLILLNPIGMRFTDTTKAGGLAAPNMDIVGISRLKGPVGGKASGVTTRGSGGDSGAAQSAEQFGNGNFNPKEYFKDAKILGGIPLADLFPSVNTNQFKQPGGLVPSLKSEEHPDKVKIPFEFTIDNVQKVNLAPVLIFDPQLPSKPSPKKSKFTLKVLVVFRFPKPGDPTVPEPEFNATGELTNFQVTIAQCIRVSFTKLRLEKKHGKSLSPDPKLCSESEDGVKPVEFLGALKFLANLQELVGGKSDSGGGGGGGGGGSSGGSSGWGVKPIIEPSTTNIKAGISVTVPTIAVGVFSLSNLKLSAAVSIFWNGDPVRFRLAISERSDPFCITVWLFGGGGFFAVEIEASERGVVLVEVLLEFGGKFAFDIGIASGGVYVMAGFYFKYGLDPETGQKGIYLEGYLRMGGQLNVLGLITVSLEFKMLIAYEEKTVGNTLTKKLWGEASLVVKIEILFFETSVTLSVRKEFQGETETIQSAQEHRDHIWLTGNQAKPVFVQNRMGNIVRPRKIYEMLSEQEWAQYAGAFAA
ncbi:MAG: hypothetical protein R3B74_00215 [Nitrospirales bacterium]|nr:hypothetical protein [Nitrospirales bacterium]